MSMKKSPRRSVTAIAAVGAIAAALVIVPSLAAPAFATDTSSTASLFTDLNNLRENPLVNAVSLYPNGYANITALERAINWANCSACGSPAAPVDAPPSTPDAPGYDHPLYAKVPVGSSTASRLLTAFKTKYGSVLATNVANVAGVGIRTKGSTVYASIELLGYPSGHLPAGLLTFARPTIVGKAAVGQTLTIHYTPAVADDGTVGGIEYLTNWYIGGTEVGGGPTFTIPYTDLGVNIHASVIAVKNNFVARDLGTANTAEVTKSLFSFADNTGKLLQFNDAVVGDLPNPTPDVVPSAYQWYRNGTAISGGTSFLHGVVAADLGKKLTMTATYSAPGYVTKVLSFSSATHFAGLVFQQHPLPTIGNWSGAPIEGDTLTSSIGTWTPNEDSYHISWQENGKTISGQHNETLLLTPSLIGKKITVSYEGEGALEVSKTETSAATPKVTD